MKYLKKALIGTGALLALLLLALIVLPLLFRDRILAHARASINRSVNAQVDWSAVGITFFRKFPNLSVTIDDLRIAGVDRFAQDTLVRADALRLVLDVRSVIAGLLKGDQMVIRSVDVDRPELRLLVLDDGSANWDIMKPSADTSAPGNFNIGLRRLQVRDARVTFDNARADVHAAMSGLQHTLSGDFRRDRFVLRTTTRADTVNAEFAGVDYLNDVALEMDAALDADMVNRTFTFQDNQLRLNELVLGFTGSVGQRDDQLELDVRLTAPSTEFKHILSLLPVMYAQDFAALQAAGAVTLDARVNGRYGPGAFPAFAVIAKVANGSFRYPDLPLPVQNISIDLAIDNAGHHADSTVVNLRRFHAELANRPIDATLLLRTPITDPDIDLELRGEVELADVQRAIKLANVSQLSGAVRADIALQGRVSDMNAGRYDRIGASGTASLRNVALKTATLPHAIAIEDAQFLLTPRHAAINAFRARIGSSDVQLTGFVDNAVGFLLSDEDLRGRASINSGTFNLDEWRSRREQRVIIPVPPRVDFTLDARIAQLIFNKLQFSNAHGAGLVKDQRATLNDFRLSAFGGTIALNGYYDTTDPVRPAFDARVALVDLSIRNAAAGMLTVRTLAPIASFVEGSFSADVNLNGVLGTDMLPLFDVLNGQGTVLTSALAVRDFPVLDQIADGLKFQQLRDPSFDGIKSSVEIRGGRMHVKPFDVKLGNTRMSVSGSNGIDQSLQYNLTLAVPRGVLGGDASRAISTLVTQTARAGIDLNADVFEVGVGVTGTVTNPAIKLDVTRSLTAAQAGIGQAVSGELQRRQEAVEERVDSAKVEAERRARVVADSVLREAEARAAQVREEARKLADNVKAEGNRQADALLARATTPLARAAAQPAADRLRKEADEKAVGIVREADRRAEQIIAEARRRTGG